MGADDFPHPPLDDDRIMRVLEEHGVEYVVREAATIEVHFEAPTWSPRLFHDNPFLHIRMIAGDVDVLLAPDGLPEGYDQLLPASVVIRPRGVAVRLAALPDLVATKKASGRTKDLEALAELEALLQAD